MKSDPVMQHISKELASITMKEVRHDRTRAHIDSVSNHSRNMRGN